MYFTWISAFKSPLFDGSKGIGSVNPCSICIFVYQILLCLQVGEWNEKGQLEMFKNKTPVWSSGSTTTPIDIPNILVGKTLKIATILVRFWKIVVI